MCKKTDYRKSINRMVKAAACIAAFLCTEVVFARPNTAADAVKQHIAVVPVDGLSPDFMRGADVSMLGEIEKNGGKFYNAAGKEDDLFAILKENGINWIRLRLWNNPVNDRDVYANGKILSRKGEPSGGGNNNLALDIKLARRAKKAGMKILLDFHYSDTWADPSKQKTPAAWRDMDAKALNKALEDFTEDSIRQMDKAGVRPAMVQIGNELNGGMMWPLGKTWKSKSDGDIGGMDGLIRLLTSASKGVRKAQGNGEKIRIVIHLANGGDTDLYTQMFDPIIAAKVDFDVIGMSFYPYWHGSFSDLKNNMTVCTKKYGKEMIVAETAYAFTEDDGDNMGNVFQVYSDDENGYVPSVQGQATEIRDSINTVSQVKGGIGVFYWEPDWIPVKGAGWRTGEGNNWENQALFDFTGHALPSLAVFNLVYGKGSVTNWAGGSAKNTDSFAPYSAEKVSAKMLPGQPPELPAKVKVVYENDAEHLADVVWDKHDWTSEKTDRTIHTEGTVKGSSFKVSADVAVSDQVNLVSDPSWESGRLGEWVLNGPAKASFVENNKSNAHTGKWTYKYWLDSGFKSILTRTLKGIPNGTYTYSVWAMGGGGENAVTVFAKDFDGTKNQQAAEVKNTGWKNWKQYSVSGIKVTNNQVTIGISLDTKSGNWGNFDDVELYQEKK
jgi:arabinogalactan endo-1,4-beta-galactosidase